MPWVAATAWQAHDVTGSSAAPAGWYPDPAGGGGQRYWDGAAWTEHTAAAPAPQPYYQGIVPATVAPRSGMPGWLLAALIGGGVLFFGLILLAIAIPTFIGARERANDRAAQSAARNALTAAKVIYTDSQSYEAATPEQLGSIEQSLAFATAPSGGVTQVSVRGTSNTFAVAVLSSSGTCWVVVDTITGEATSDTRYGQLPDGVPCAASVIDAASLGGSWR
jgi:type II secretory pathway pseudopilin PulG